MSPFDGTYLPSLLGTAVTMLDLGLFLRYGPATLASPRAVVADELGP